MLHWQLFKYGLADLIKTRGFFFIDIAILVSISYQTSRGEKHIFSCSVKWLKLYHNKFRSDIVRLKYVLMISSIDFKFILFTAFAYPIFYLDKWYMNTGSFPWTLWHSILNIQYCPLQIKYRKTIQMFIFDLLNLVMENFTDTMIFNFIHWKSHIVPSSSRLRAFVELVFLFPLVRWSHDYRLL